MQFRLNLQITCPTKIPISSIPHEKLKKNPKKNLFSLKFGILYI